MLPVYGNSRRSLLPIYGSSRRSLLPIYGSSRRSMLPVYGDEDPRRSLLPVYGSEFPPPYGSHPPAYGSYGGDVAISSRRSMGSQSTDREALHQALAFVLNKQKGQKSDSDTSVAGVSITGPKNCPQGFRRSLKRALPNAPNPTYECMPLTTASKNSVVSNDQVKQPSKGVLPDGKCYCKFDHDWDEWSLSEPRCRNALYERSSDLRSGLPSSWLDGYYNYRPKLGSIISPPHVDQISAFLYSDCRPSPPCSCNNLTLESSMSPKALSCYTELQIQAADPYRQVPARVLQVAVTQGHSGGAEGVEEWMASSFPAPSCKAYQGQPYTYQALPSTLAPSTAGSSSIFDFVDLIGGWKVVAGVVVGVSISANFFALALYCILRSKREEAALREKLIGGDLVY